MKINSKLKKIRALMNEQSIDCYLIPHTDEFSNEFLPPYSRRLEWISNFSGSAGDIIITKTRAYLFVDGRYTIQASQEVDKSSYRIFNYKDKTIHDLLSKIAKDSFVIGFDGILKSIIRYNFYKKNWARVLLLNQFTII